MLVFFRSVKYLYELEIGTDKIGKLNPVNQSINSDFHLNQLFKTNSRDAFRLPSKPRMLFCFFLLKHDYANI